MSWDNTVKRTHRTTPTNGVGQLEIETENRGTRHTTIYEGGEFLSEDDIQGNVSWIIREGTYDGVWVSEYVERSRDDRGTMYSGSETIEFQHGLTPEESWFKVTYGEHAECGPEICSCWGGTGYWYGITGAHHGAPPAVCVGMDAWPTNPLPIPAIGSTSTAPAGIVVAPPTIANSVCLPARQGVFSGRNRLNVEGVTKSNIFDTSHEDDPLGPKKSCRVLQTYENGLQNIVKLYLKVVETGREFYVRTSVGHRLYVLDHGFEHAQDVPIGARMINYNQQVVEVLAVELEPEPELVYNFEVEEAHTYFVGDDAECCVLGHNQDCTVEKPGDVPYSYKSMAQDNNIVLSPEQNAEFRDGFKRGFWGTVKFAANAALDFTFGKVTHIAGGAIVGVKWIAKGNRAIKAADAIKAGDNIVGQIHHPISKRIASALGRNTNVSEEFMKNYKNFTTRAKNLASHNGYDAVHRKIDADMVEWLNDNTKATQQEIVEKLKDLYGKKDIADKFPNFSQDLDNWLQSLGKSNPKTPSTITPQK